MTEEGENGAQKPTVSQYEEAMDALSSLITKRSRADSSNKGDRFDLLFDYLKMLELDEPISQMKIIHVAGTKGKGSTCTFTESILRNCGFHTGVFTSPHLIDIRERFRLDGVDICEEKFLAYFWWCWDRLKENTNEDIPMPTYFRFLALLAFKIFASEQVDVAILEVGLGGKFDATNVVQKPIVCGISSLGFDHMEILGNTLGEIAGEKAGIFKHGVPAFTAPQPDEAMRVLEEKASHLDVCLQVAPPLDANLLNGLKLALEGEHQYLNAGLAIALCSTWLQRTGHLGVNCLEQTLGFRGYSSFEVAEVHIKPHLKILLKWALDINKFACESLKLNHPETQIRNESAEDFLDLLKEWDKLCKRYAVKDVEGATKSNIKLLRASQNNLYSKTDEKIPSGEYEVASLIDICYGDPSDTGKRGLKFQVRWVGYGPSEDTWEPIEGLSKCEDRIQDFFLKGFKAKILPRPGANFRDLSGVVVGADNVARRDPTAEPILLPSGRPLVPDYALNFCEGKSTRPFGRLWWDETVPTVICRPDSHSQVALHPEQDRILTVRENARLQWFPDYYRFCGEIKERYCQIGNAVAIPVARALGYALGMAVQKLSRDEPLMTLPPKFSNSTTIQLLQSSTHGVE